jgi:5-formyltetrahydrofolate cyclo-ligase
MTRRGQRKAASISGVSPSARRVTLGAAGHAPRGGSRWARLCPVDLGVMGRVAAGEDGARLGKGGWVIRNIAAPGTLCAGVKA